MSNERFSIGKSNDEDRMAPDDLTTEINDWKLIADQFYRSSEIIFVALQNESSEAAYYPQLDPVYFFLTGMCLENMIKGILSYQTPDLVKGAKLNRKLGTHDLKFLANDIKGCKFTDEEKQLFEFLTEHTVWISKYPIPKKAEDFYEWMYYQTESVREVFLLVYNKLSRLMEATGDLLDHLHNYKFSPNK